MPRPLRMPRREDFSEAEQADYDRVVERFRPGTPVGEEPKPDCYFGALLHSPPFAGNRQDASSLVRTAGERGDTYSHTDREFVDQVLAVELATNVVQRRHVPDAIAVGVRIEAIDALRSGDASSLTDDERLLADYIRQFVNGAVTDETRDAMELRLGTRGLVEYTYFIGVLWMTMRQYQAFGCPDPPDDEIAELIDKFRSGDQELPNWRAYIR